MTEHPKQNDVLTTSEDLSEGDVPSVVTVEAPIEPGFYRYSGGRQTLIFLLDYNQLWWVISDNSEMARCVWEYIEQALGVWDLVKIEEDAPEHSRAIIDLPVHMPGNNRNWETVAGVAKVTADGSVRVTFSDPKSSDALVHMAEERILLQLSFDYRQSEDHLKKVNTQFQMEYADDHTMAKVRSILNEDHINQLQEAGLFFRERK